MDLRKREGKRAKSGRIRKETEEENYVIIF